MPRIVYGIYSQHVFEESLQRLQGLIGEENVVIHTNTNVIAIDAASNLRFEEDSQIKEKNFTTVVLGTGRWQADLSQPETNVYVPNVWPISHLEDRVNDLIAEAKKSGKEEVKIAVEGASLSAIDVVKTLFRDCAIGSFQEEDGKLIFCPNEELGVNVKVDMVSRNGMLNSVRGSFNWFSSEVGKYYSDAVKEVAARRGIFLEESDDPYYLPRKAADKIIEDQVAKNGDGKVHLWQVANIFLEVLETAYRQNGLHDKADLTIETINFVAENKDNYQNIVSALTDRAKNPFQKLAEDIQAAKGDLSGGDYLFERIYAHFSDFSNYAQYLPAEEKMLTKLYRSIFTSYGAPMPPESARELMAFHESGNFNVVGIGFDSQRKFGDNFVSYVKSDGTSHDYDLAVNSTGTRLNFKKSPDSLYRSVTDANEVATERFVFCKNDEEFAQKTAEMNSRMGEALTKTLLSDKHLSKQEDGSYLFDSEEPAMKSIRINGEHDVPKILILRKVMGILFAVQSGNEEARNLVDKTYERDIPSLVARPSEVQRYSQDKANTMEH